MSRAIPQQASFSLEAKDALQAALTQIPQTVPCDCPPQLLKADGEIGNSFFDQEYSKGKPEEILWQ